jgi:serine protease Do
MTINPQTRIVVRHLSGSKVNQVEQIPLKDLHEITIGRDPSSGIAYDQRRDDVVSRQHAAIRIQNGDDKLSFRLADLNSSNGTLLNGEPVTGEVELAPEDTIELGRGGPRFTFDVQPRPDNLTARTRVMSAMDANATRTMSTAAADIGPNGKGTREIGAITGTRETAPGKPSVGKETVMRMLFQERQKSSRVWMSSIAAVIAVLIAAGGGLWWHNRTVADQLRREAAAEAQNARAAAERQASQQMTQQLGANARDIVTKYGDSTVVVNVQWRMYDRLTGLPLFHKVIALNQKKSSPQLYPAFIKLPNGRIVRWLTTSDGNRRNIAIGLSSSGSGFVVSDQGHILTNKHVAADWMTNFEEIGWKKNAAHQGYLVDYSDSAKKKVTFKIIQLDDIKNEQRKWIPEEGGYVFAEDIPVLIGGNLDNRRVFQGRNELLEVRFAGNRVSVQASLVRASTDADAALMKIDMSGLRPVELDQRDDDVDVGDRVMVLGYPGISAETFVRTSSVEVGRVGTGRVESVPEPTISEGIIQLKGRGYKEDGDVTILGSMGDTYQMSINSTGHGNSGGPVFNTKGQVVGLFTYGVNVAGDAAVTYAVPIKHGRALLNPQRATSN